MRATRSEILDSASPSWCSLAGCARSPILAKIYSAAVYGVDAYEVEIEVKGGRGLPDAAVKESRDRVTMAISNSGYDWAR